MAAHVALTEEELRVLIRRCRAFPGQDGVRAELLDWLHRYACRYVRSYHKTHPDFGDLPSIILAYFLERLSRIVRDINLDKTKPTSLLWKMAHDACSDYFRSNGSLLFLLPNRELAEMCLPYVGNGSTAIEAKDELEQIERRLVDSLHHFRFPRYQHVYRYIVNHWLEFFEEPSRSREVPELVWFAALYLLRAVIEPRERFFYSQFYRDGRQRA